jgi:hypothetical protein
MSLIFNLLKPDAATAINFMEKKKKTAKKQNENLDFFLTKPF